MIYIHRIEQFKQIARILELRPEIEYTRLNALDIEVQFISGIKEIWILSKDHITSRSKYSYIVPEPSHGFKPYSTNILEHITEHPLIYKDTPEIYKDEPYLPKEKYYDQPWCTKRILRHRIIDYFNYTGYLKPWLPQIEYEKRIYEARNIILKSKFKPNKKIYYNNLECMQLIYPCLLREIEISQLKDCFTPAKLNNAIDYLEKHRLTINRYNLTYVLKLLYKISSKSLGFPISLAQLLITKYNKESIENPQGWIKIATEIADSPINDNGLYIVEDKNKIDKPGLYFGKINNQYDYVFIFNKKIRTLKHVR